MSTFQKEKAVTTVPALDYKGIFMLGQAGIRSASHQDRLPSTIHSTIPAPSITMQRQTRERRSSRRKNETSLATVAEPQNSEHGTAMSKEESTPPLEPSPSIMQEPITVPYAVFIGER